MLFDVLTLCTFSYVHFEIAAHSAYDMFSKYKYLRRKK